jgi:hypothetical protein
MRTFSRLSGLVAACALTVVVAGVARAQTCLGYSSLDQSHMNLTGAVGFMASPSQDGTQFGGQWNTRHESVPNSFLGLTVGASSYDSPVNRSSTRIIGAAGFENRSATNHIDWCPNATLGYEAGPGSNLSTWEFGAGVGFGKALASNGTYALVPFGSVGLSHLHTSRGDCIGGEPCNSSQTAGVFMGGVGFRFTNGMQISPDLTFTTFDNSNPMLAVGVSFPLGGGRSTPPRRR